ncbi:ABC transporter substrate-binding protein [Actinokineospora fastidiosa]|uniref:ABC transporter substrate-binding protein n=1 Tax=Actinokineospora fastidiosa TaxID=1816 RepID=UPI001E2D5FC6|nr:ABC transporter substrate-binding protein [Actinokineospora fastidiosa]
MRRTLLMAAALVAAGCSAAPTVPAPAPAPPSVDRTAAPLDPALAVTDPHGVRIELPAPPERIVCLNGLCDDIVVDLGLVPAGTSNPTLISHPALLGERGKAVPVVAGSFGGEDVESIAALDPDLVIGLEGVHEALRPAIERFAPLWLAEPATWEESVGYLRALGALTGRTAEAVAAETRFRGVLADTAASDRTVVVIYGSADAIGVDTADSLKGHLLDAVYDYPFPAKGTDAATASNYSVEELLARQPDTVFVYSLLFSTSDKPLSEQLADNPVWRQIPAVRDGAVHEVHPKLWGSGRGLRSLEAVLAEARGLAP